MKRSALILILALVSSIASGCSIYNSNGSIASLKGDALSQLLHAEAECPHSVIDFKRMLIGKGFEIEAAMVANRGRQNPKLGSFSLFETVTGQTASGMKLGMGEFLFGHFTKLESRSVILDKNNEPHKLMIELIVWDPKQQFFNFYELIGGKAIPKWFYRGNSLDALADNKFLYRTGASKFGTRMRCSACHASGGPIMKELTAPHNDWWKKDRQLIFGQNTLSEELKVYVKQLVDASKFSQHVKTGMTKLEQSTSYQRHRDQLSFQEQLRPLFCENEINLVSDNGKGNLIEIHGAFLANDLWKLPTKKMFKASYQQLIKKWEMKFPETSLTDADHSWLAPVKGQSDLMAIKTLIKKGVISEELVFDILAVDFENPLFSQKKCGLLKLISNNKDWLNHLIVTLKSSRDSTAQELLTNILHPERNAEFHKSRLLASLEDMSDEATFKKLVDIRSAVFKSEISKNPLGQILEPGFRVIFPVPAK